MNVKLGLILSICAGVLTGCGQSGGISGDVHNEVIGLYTSVDDNIYYVDNDVLFMQSGGNINQISDNVLSVQKQDDTVYCVYTEDHKNYSLCRLNGYKLEELLELNSGTYQQSVLYNNKLYECINNQITIYDLQIGEKEKLPIENPVTRFIVDNSGLYYWSVGFADTSMDSYVDSIKNGGGIQLFEGRLYSYDLNTNISAELARSSSEKDMFFISPTEHGIVFYDPENLTLDIYNKGVKTLYSGEITSMITDDNNIYFSAGDNNIYRLDAEKADTEIFTDDVNMIKGMDSQYVFNGDDLVLIND